MNQLNARLSKKKSKGWLISSGSQIAEELQDSGSDSSGCSDGLK
jgi:hypothetical protein